MDPVFGMCVPGTIIPEVLSLLEAGSHDMDTSAKEIESVTRDSD